MKDLKKQRALELLVMISEDFIKLSFESINYQRLVDYIIELSDAKYAVFNLVDDDDESMQTTVAFSCGDISCSDLSSALNVDDLIGSRWQINHDSVRWEYETESYSIKLPGTAVRPILKVYNSISEIKSIPLEQNSINQLEQLLDIEQCVLVRLMDDKRLIGNFLLFMKPGDRFSQHYAVRIYSRQLSQLLIRRNREKEINRLLKENFIIFNSTQDMLVLIRRKGLGSYTFVRVNDIFSDLTGLRTEDIIDRDPLEAFGPIKGAEIISHNDDCLLAEVPVSYELEVELPSGDKVFQVTLNPVIMGKESYIVASAKDITEERSNQERVEYLSFHDQLTGLYNRHYFNHSLRRLDNARNLPLSLIMIDVNGLKLVNDAFGHSLGDQLLHTVGQLISEHSRSDDIVCRIGGDEFVFILPQTDEAGTETVVKRLRDACRDVYLGPFQLSFSLGWATRNNLEMSTRELMQQAEEWMYKHKLIESPAMRNQVIRTIAEIMSRMPYESAHADSTAIMAAEIASSLGWSERRIRKISRACFYHDIGKIVIPPEILNKTEPLDDREIALIRRHSETGYRILSSSNDFTDIANSVLEHHERWDGKGYPRRLAGEKISQSGRIINLVDSFDDMTSERPWRRAKTLEEALEELQNCAGYQFDPALVKLFIDEKIYKKKIT